MQSRQHWHILIGAVLVAGIIWIALTRVQPETTPTVAAADPTAASASTPAPQVGRPAPPFNLETSDGAPVNLVDLRGRVVMVNIWATWCPPCRAEMPMIEAAFREYRDEGFVVLAVNLREDATTVAAYMQQSDLTFPALLDHDGAVGAAYRANVVPSSFFIDRQGIVRAVYRGPLPRSVIAGTVEQLLAEAP
ncbi:MAG: TlpA family protein disulfide reductase [Oscillochloris sp.]|nr:TlpA family protein disulfide reductase [Oscillochloris sp.]